MTERTEERRAYQKPVLIKSAKMVDVTALPPPASGPIVLP